MIKIKAPRAGFYILAAALALSIAACIMYSATFSAFHFVSDKWVIALMVISIWSIACLMINSLFMGNKPMFVDALYIVAVFALVTAAVKFFTPCLSPIGIYFTVHNMGDVEANEIGVPRSIAGIIVFVLAILCVVVSAFFRMSKRETAGAQSDDAPDAPDAPSGDETSDAPDAPNADASDAPDAQNADASDAPSDASKREADDEQDRR